MGKKIQSKFQSIPLAMLIGVALSSPADAQKASTPSQIIERTIERRAIEAVNWGIPVVNFDRMVQATLGANGAFNQIVFWSGFSDWKNQTLIPNPDTIYFKPLGRPRSPGVAYVYAPDRKHARPAEHLAGFRGTLRSTAMAPIPSLHNAATSCSPSAGAMCGGSSTTSRRRRRRRSPPRRWSASLRSMPSKPTFAACPPTNAARRGSGAASRSSMPYVCGWKPSSPPSPASRLSPRRSATRSRAGTGRPLPRRRPRRD